MTDLKDYDTPPTDLWGLQCNVTPCFGARLV